MDGSLAPEAVLPRLRGPLRAALRARRHASRGCADAIAALTGLGPELKFPNDVLVAGRKVAGILAEAREERVVLGIGLNVNVPAQELPQEVERPATSLLVETGREVDRAELLVELLDRLERRYDDWVSAAR